MDIALIIPFISIVVLIVLSGFFSGSETGLTAVSKGKIHTLKNSGNKRAKIVSKLREDKDGLIGTLLLGNNAVNILASALATSLAIDYFGDNGVIYATIIMTLAVLIFAEVLPKTYAFYNAERISLFVAPVILILVKIFLPITKSVQIIVDIFMKIIGVKKDYVQQEDDSSDELRGAIDLQHFEGKMVKHDKDMLSSILDLSEVEIQEIALHRKNIHSIDVNKPNSEIIDFVLDSNYTRIPIWEESPDNIIGILHAKLLLKEVRKSKDNIDDIDIKKLAIEPWFVPETNNLRMQLLQFRQKRNHMALLVDEYGALAGLVTLEDILEEIVGQIDDESDFITSIAKKVGNDKYLIKGDASIRDINRNLDWKLSDEDASTIAGLLINVNGDIPQKNTEIIIGKLKFKIISKKDNQIIAVLVTVGVDG